MIRLSPSFVWLNADSMPHDPFLNDLLLRSSRSNGESVDNNSIDNYNLFQVRDKIITGYITDIIPTWKAQTDYLLDH